MDDYRADIFTRGEGGDDTAKRLDMEAEIVLDAPSEAGDIGWDQVA